MADLPTKGSFTGPQWSTLVELIQPGAPEPPLANLLTRGETLYAKKKRKRIRRRKKREPSNKCCGAAWFLPPGVPLEYPSQTRSTAKEGSEDEVKFLVCSRSPPKPCSRPGAGTALSFAGKSSSMVFQHLKPLLQVCALVQAGGNLETFDPPKLHTRFNVRKNRSAGGGEDSQMKIETFQRHPVVVKRGEILRGKTV